MVLRGLDEWESALNAKLYDNYARTHPLYRETSANLVDALSLAADSRAVDLACGTGVTTEALLARLGTDGSVIALDGSQAMLDVAMQRVPDARVRWLRADALAVASVVRKPCDVLVCNSAIWQLGGLGIFGAIRGALRAGGECVFNSWAVPPRSRESAGPSGSAGPSLVTVARRIATERYGYVQLAPEPPRADAFPLRNLTTDKLVAIVEAAGLDVVERWWFAQSSEPAGASEAFLRIPVMTEWYLPGMAYELRMEILEKAADELGLLDDPGPKESDERPAQAIPDGGRGSGVGWFCIRAVAR